MFGLGFPELVIIVIAFIVLFFGGKKLTDFARGMGRFTGEYKKGKAEIDSELKDIKKEVEKEVK